MILDKKKIDTTNLDRVCNLYLDNVVSATTLSTITQPMAGLPLEQREQVAAKIMALADKATSEQELISMVKKESVNW